MREGHEREVARRADDDFRKQSYVRLGGKSVSTSFPVT